MRCAVSLLVVAVLAAVSGPARGTVIFDNGAPSGFTFTLTPSVQAEDFSLDEPAIVGGVRFPALERLGGFSGSMSWSIRGDDAAAAAAAQPAAVEIAGGTTSAVTRTLTGFIDPNHKNAAEGIYSFDVPPLALGPGHYWLILHNGPLSNDAADGFPGFFLWEGNGDPRGAAGLEDPSPFDAAWQPSLGERSFQLLGVPEPGTTALALSGGACIVALRRGRGRRARESPLTRRPHEVVISSKRNARS